MKVVCWRFSPYSVFGEKELKEGGIARSMSPALSVLKVALIELVSTFLMAESLTPGVQEERMLVV